MLLRTCLILCIFVTPNLSIAMLRAGSHEASATQATASQEDMAQVTRGPLGRLFGLDIELIPLAELLRVAIVNTDGDAWRPRHDHNFYDAIARINMEEDRDELELFSLGYLIWLCQSAVDAGIDYEAIVKEYMVRPWNNRYTLHNPGIHLWSRLVNALNEDPRIPQEVRAVLQAHLESTRRDNMQRSAYFPHIHDMVFNDAAAANYFVEAFQNRLRNGQTDEDLVCEVETAAR